MLKYEVLAPAGELAAIKPLIDAGANAIYVGLNGFSSRPQSADFSIEEIEKAVDICHNNEVKLYVAINGCISEQSLAKVYCKLKQLDALRVDAVIIADWGVLAKASQYLHSAEIHASTLLGVYNSSTISYLTSLRVSRTVLSTNLYLDEMASIVNSSRNMDFEIVADGGICFNDNRICELPHSNDGDNYMVCCRQTFELNHRGKTTSANRISAKQITSSEIIDLYMELGILSFKIEGRTVNYKYVEPRVKMLRSALDTAASKSHLQYSTLHYISERTRKEIP